jgi:hypothetical protein
MAARTGRNGAARDHAALGPRPARPARNLENPWMAQKTPFRQTSCLKNPFLLNGAKCALQIFSKTFLGRFGGFQWVGAKKNWKALFEHFRDSAKRRSTSDEGRSQGPRIITAIQRLEKKLFVPFA